MATTVATVILEVRGLLQDLGGTKRYSDGDIATYIGDSLDLLASYLPPLFYGVTDYPCVAGARQLFPNVNSKGVVEVLEVKDGGALTAFDRDALDSFNPRWRTLKQSVPTQWCTVNDDPYAFDVFVPATLGTVLRVMHVAVPTNVTTSDTLDGRLTAYTHLMVDYAVGMCEAREAEDVGPNRSAAFIGQFTAKLRGMKEAKK